MYQHFGNSLHSIARSLQQISENGIKQSDSPTSVIAAVGTLGAVFAAVFATFWPNIHRFLTRPKLDFGFQNEEPFCRHTFFNLNIGTTTMSRQNSYHIRLRIKNNGKSLAKNCVCKLIAIAHKDLKSLRKDFDPVVLNWVGSDIIVRNLEQVKNEAKSSIQFSKKRSVEINKNSV
jgi:hypothetical protein